jgi:hypothetical protein
MTRGKDFAKLTEVLKNVSELVYTDISSY